MESRWEEDGHENDERRRMGNRPVAPDALELDTHETVVTGYLHSTIVSWPFPWRLLNIFQLSLKQQEENKKKTERQLQPPQQQLQETQKTKTKQNKWNNKKESFSNGTVDYHQIEFEC